MLKIAKVENEKTGLCSIAVGTDKEYYRSIGMTELDVQQSDVDQCWYLSEKCPHKSAEEKEQEEKEQRITELKRQLDEIDKKKIRSTSAIALNIATQTDYAKLQELEQQAETIRQQLQALGGV